jgi:hypothetical protein
LGLQEIVNLRASINNGLSDSLSGAFPNTKPVTRPIVEFKGIPDPAWIVGFIEGEGCFYVKFSKSETHKLGTRIELVFTVTQHIRDEQLIKSLVQYLDCGSTRLD